MRIVDRVNGYGPVFRYITPALIAIVIFILTTMRNDIRDVKSEQTILAKEVQVYFMNHLKHHADFEKAIENRLTAIETKIDKRR